MLVFGSILVFFNFFASPSRGGVINLPSEVLAGAVVFFFGVGVVVGGVVVVDCCAPAATGARTIAPKSRPIKAGL
jgi:hypothetical protein